MSKINQECACGGSYDGTPSGKIRHEHSARHAASNPDQAALGAREIEILVIKRALVKASTDYLYWSKPQHIGKKLAATMQRKSDHVEELTHWLATAVWDRDLLKEKLGRE